jgi:hypothetical protein
MAPRSQRQHLLLARHRALVLWRSRPLWPRPASFPPLPKPITPSRCSPRQLERRVQCGELPRISLDNAGDRLLLRLERQTLRRLPHTGAIVFTIKTHQIRLRDVVADFELADRLRRHYASMLGTPMASGKTPYKRHVQTLCQWLAPRMSCQAQSGALVQSANGTKHDVDEMVGHQRR